MRVVLLLNLAVIATVSVRIEIYNFYHKSYGIPRAQRIKDFEDNIIDQKIIGGADAPITAHPYLAGLIISLINTSGSSVCGSTIISDNRLVTAAHCWDDGHIPAWRFLVVLGSSKLYSGGTRIATTNVVVHPEWSPGTLQNDVAVIILPTTLIYGTNIRPVDLPNQFEMSETFDAQWAVAAGFGRTYDDEVTMDKVLSDVSLQLISVYQCQRVYGVLVTLSKICTSGAGKVGICYGDSGGPLVIYRDNRTVLIGISSFVAESGCKLGLPSVFSRVTSYYNFIVQDM